MFNIQLFLTSFLTFLVDVTPLDGISDVLETVFGWIGTLFTSVVAIFWNSTTGFTFVGTLLLVSFGLSMVWVIINFIRSLVKRG